MISLDIISYLFDFLFGGDHLLATLFLIHSAYMIRKLFLYQNVVVDGKKVDEETVKGVKHTSQYVKYTLGVVVANFILIVYFDFIPIFIKSEFSSSFIWIAGFLLLFYGRTLLSFWLFWRCPHCGKVMDGEFLLGYRWISRRPVIRENCPHCEKSILYY